MALPLGLMVQCSEPTLCKDLGAIDARILLSEHVVAFRLESSSRLGRISEKLSKI